MWLYCNLPAMCAVALLMIPLGLSVALPDAGATEREPLPPAAVALAIGALGLLIWGVWRMLKYFPAAIRLVDHTIHDRASTVRACYREISARLTLDALLLAVLATVMIGALLAVPVVLGALYAGEHELITGTAGLVGVVLAIVVGLWWVFATVSLVLEGKTGAEAFRRARVLMRGGYWRLIVVYLGIFALANVLNIVSLSVMGVFSALSDVNSGSEGSSVALTTLSTLVFGALTAGAFVAASVLAFYEAHVRLEGLDLHLEMDEIEADQS